MISLKQKATRLPEKAKRQSPLAHKRHFAGLGLFGPVHRTPARTGLPEEQGGVARGPGEAGGSYINEPTMAPPSPPITVLAKAAGKPIVAPPNAAPNAAPTRARTVAIVTCSLAVSIVAPTVCAPPASGKASPKKTVALLGRQTSTHPSVF